ncbi:MAG: metal ABC transporter substrate-binding protein [Planctomycetota bacterium]|jgi:zinc transport system substrate-binding protein|nr:metal ABC transporter substrate-binding protein [Planctomycetota bacterium]
MRTCHLLIVLGCVFLFGCAGGASVTPADHAGKPVVYVVNEPLRQFAAAIAGTDLDLRPSYTKQGDPAFAEPDDALLQGLQQADLLVLNGAGYEKWREGLSLPASIQVNTSVGYELIATEASTAHRHGAGAAHQHGDTAFTTWMDYRQAAAQVRMLGEALAGLVPERASAYLQASAEVQTQLLELDAEMAALAQQIGDRPLIVSHPVYQYWARRYGVNVRALHWEPDVVPDAAALAELATLRDGFPAEWMIWEGEPLAASVAALEQLGVRSVVVDPGGNAEGDWFRLQHDNLERLRQAFVSGGLP